MTPTQPQHRDDLVSTSSSGPWDEGSAADMCRVPIRRRAAQYSRQSMTIARSSLRLVGTSGRAAPPRRGSPRAAPAAPPRRAAGPRRPRGRGAGPRRRRRSRAGRRRRGAAAPVSGWWPTSGSTPSSGPRRSSSRQVPLPASRWATGGCPALSTRYCPGGQVHPQVRRGREALGPALLQQVAVGLGEEVLRRHRAEQAAERARQQQRPGAGVDSLAGHVDQGQVEQVVPAVRGLDRVHPGDDEVAGQPGVVGRAQLDLHPPLRPAAAAPRPAPAAAPAGRAGSGPAGPGGPRAAPAAASARTRRRRRRRRPAPSRR